MGRIEVWQEEIEAAGRHFIVTRIPTATQGGWFIVHDAFEMWGAVAIDDIATGEVIGWRSPPDDDNLRVAIEKVIKKTFNIPIK